MQDDPNDSPLGAQSSSNDQPTQSGPPSGATNDDTIPPSVQPGNLYGPPWPYQQPPIPYTPPAYAPPAYEQSYAPSYQQPQIQQLNPSSSPAYVPPQAFYTPQMNWEQQANWRQQTAPTTPQPRPADGARAWVKQHKGWTAVISTMLAVFALCAVCSMCSAMWGAISSPVSANAVRVDATSTAQAQQKQQQQVAQPTAQPAATPKPTATPNANADALTWKTMTQGDAQTLVDDSNAMANSCGAVDFEGCLSDTQTFQSDVEAFQADLAANPAPPCLSSANKYLGQALALYDKGSGKIIDGIQNIDANEITQGSNTVKSGTPYINKATAAIQNAHC